jgi:hypothetical protein
VPWLRTLHLDDSGFAALALFERGGMG